MPNIALIIGRHAVWHVYMLSLCIQESQRQARLAACLATPGITGQERSTGELLNSAVRRLAVASDVNTQLR